MIITVVICLFNAEYYIEQTLLSILNQKYSFYKLLLIDDASTDESLNKAENCLKNQKEVDYKIIKQLENKGTAYTRNVALKTVDTPLMMFFDADDIAKPDMLEKLTAKMYENENYIAVSCFSKYIDLNGRALPGGQYLGSTVDNDFFERANRGKLIFMLPPTLFRTEYAKKAGGYRLSGFPKGGLRYEDLSEDLDLWSRMSDFYNNGKIMITIPEVLFYYRKNTTTVSASKKSLFAMQHKMRFIKTNLKRRRNGLTEITFLNYLENLTKRLKVKYYLKDSSAYFYRKAGFAYVNKNYLSFILNMALSFIYWPNYLMMKVKNNFIK